MLPKAGIEYVLGMKLWSEEWWRWVLTVFQAKQVTSLPDTLTRAGHSLCGHAETQIRAIRTTCVGLGGGVESHTALLCCSSPCPRQVVLVWGAAGDHGVASQVCLVSSSSL